MEKSDVTATITQQKTDFTMSDLKANSGEGTSTTGTVSATDLTAGSWTGTLNFDISLKYDYYGFSAWKTSYELCKKL